MAVCDPADRFQGVMLAWVAWIVLAVMVSAGLWFWLRETYELMAPLPIALLTVALYFLPRSAYLLLFGQAPLSSGYLPAPDRADLIATTLALGSAAIAAFLFGHRSASAVRLGKHINFALPNPDFGRALLIGGVCGAIGLLTLLWVFQSVGGIGYVLSHQYELGNLLQGKVSLLQLSRLLIIPVALLLIDPDKGRSRWWVWLFALVAAGALASLGRRGLIILAIAYPLGLYHLLVKRVALRRLIPFGTAGGIVFLWFGLLRPFGAEHLGRAFRAFARQPVAIAHFAINATGEFKIFDAATIVVRDVPAQQELSYGATFLRVPFMIVPRALWTTKPVTLGEVLVARHIPQVKAGYPPMALGEFYAAGGPFAVLLGFFALGWFGRCAWEWFQKRRTPGSASVYLAVCYFFFDFTRVGDPSRTFWFFLIGFVSVTVAFCVSSRTLGPRSMSPARP